MDVKLQSGFYFLSGKLDEHADLSAIEKAQSPIRFNLRGLGAINSNGVRKFLAFVLAHPSYEMEFHECATEFIANVNVIPQLLGVPPDPSKIKSLFVPLCCENCDVSDTQLIQFKDLKQSTEGRWNIAQMICPQCKNPMEFDVEPSSFFIFMEDAA